MDKELVINESKLNSKPSQDASLDSTATLTGIRVVLSFDAF